MFLFQISLVELYYWITSPRVVYAAWPQARKRHQKNIYKSVSTNVASSCCRLCGNVIDKDHSRDLFKPKNCAILKNAEEFYGQALPRDNSLPHLLCRPCERRLNNAVKFRNVIAETQKRLLQDTRTKRCLEISPSVSQPSSRARTSDSPNIKSQARRRSLDFTETTPPTLQVRYLD